MGGQLPKNLPTPSQFSALNLKAEQHSIRFAQKHMFLGTQGMIAFAVIYTVVK